VNRTVLATLFLGLSSLAFAQQLKPTFDVVSVRPQEVAQRFGDPNAVAKIRPGGVFSGTHSTVEWLLLFAYDLKPFQIIGGPNWIRTTNFAIDARTASSESAAAVKLMVQSLLQDRFQLVARRGQRDIPHLDLVLARPDRGLGPYLKEVTEDCEDRSNVAEVRKQLPPRKPVESPGAMMAGTCVPLRALSPACQIISIPPWWTQRV
jgi:uncharacterized protein (TIGR03435 family)